MPRCMLARGPMSAGSCDGERFESAYRLPEADRAGDWLVVLGRAGLSVQRTRLAARLGWPDPFHVRALAGRAAADAPVVLISAGRPLDPDAADAALIEAAVDRSDAAGLLASLFADRAPGPRVRAVGVDLAPDHPLAAVLRWPIQAGQGVRLGSPRWTPAEALGLPAHATIRLIAPTATGVVAGSDLGAALWDGAWTPFPFPPGARRPWVDAVGAHGTTVHVVTREAWFSLANGRVRSRRLPSDGADGRDDVRALTWVGGRRLVAWRTRFEGATGPADALCLAADPAGVVYAGTRDGALHVVDGGPVRSLGAHVRHLAFAAGALWAAAGGHLHRFDGATWTRRPGEPVHLWGTADRLWAIREGRVETSADPDGWPAPLDLPVERPWCAAVARGRLWVGAPGGVLEVELC